MRKLFLENLALKVVAVLLSIVLWIFVTLGGQSEISVGVPLDFENIPAGLEMVSSSAKMVSLNIKGRERLIKDIKPSDVRAYVDLSEAKKGEGVYHINKDDIKLPHAATIKNITPSSVKVIAGETVTKDR